MKKYTILFLLLLGFYLSINAQSYNPDSVGLYSEEDHTAYTAMQKIVRGNQPLSYGSILPFISATDRIFPLHDGEGRTKLAILEANINLLYPLWGSRPQANHCTRKTLVSLNYNPTIRMYFDPSSPILPTNQKIGLQGYYIFKENFSRPDKCIGDENFYDNRKWRLSRGNRQMHYAIANVAHYSNGQNGLSIIKANEMRNNYVNGNFSTNYFNLSYAFTCLHHLSNSTLSFSNHSILSFSVGYQRDGHVVGPLSYDTNQNKRYGKNRIIGFIQYRSGPTARKSTVPWSTYKINRDTCIFDEELKVKRIWTHLFRFEFEGILDNTKLYNHTNKSRFNVHFFYECSPYRWRSSAMFVHLYSGRDYLNIRYDDLIFTAMVGFTFAIPKFRDPAFNQFNL